MIWPDSSKWGSRIISRSGTPSTPRTWGAFDLGRSALLRAGSRREVERLETALRYHFGDPAAEAAARAQGRTLTSADFRAMGSSRRHPGRCDDGYTEFYTNRCFEAMFDLAQRSAGLGEGRAAPRLIRGIDPAYCVWHGEGDPNSAPATRDHGPGSRAGLRARREQESNELEAKNSAKISQVLAVAQEYAEHLLWVDLRAWRERRDLNLPDLHSREGLVSLFFDGFRAAATGGDAGAEPRSSWQIAFEARLAPILAPAVSSDPRGWLRTQAEAVGVLQAPHERFHAVPRHLRGVDTLMLRIMVYPADLDHSLFAQFEALARRVENRRGHEQPDFPW